MTYVRYDARTSPEVSAVDSGFAASRSAGTSNRFCLVGKNCVNQDNTFRRFKLLINLIQVP